MERLDRLSNAVDKWLLSTNIWLPDNKSDYDFIKKNLTLESLQEAKAKGATFWSLSDAEWIILAQAATSLSPYLSKTAFKRELDRIKSQIYANYPWLQISWWNMSPMTQNNYNNLQNLVNNLYWSPAPYWFTM